MDYYSNIPFRQLQREAKQLGTSKVSGKGINRPFLLSEVEKTLYQQECSVKSHLLDHTVNSSKEILKHNNEELYYFIESIIEEIPSLRQEPILPFKESPWNMILDELNAMNNNDYNTLSLFVNGNESDLSKMIVVDKENIVLFLERFSVLSYAVLLRRTKDDSWILNTIVLSGSSTLQPYSKLLDKPLRPFSSLYLAEKTEKVQIYMKEAFEYIKLHHFDENLYALYLYIVKEKLYPDHPHASIFLDLLSSTTIDQFPLNKTIFFIYVDIFYKIEGLTQNRFDYYHELRYASLFAFHITQSVFRPTTSLTLFTIYINHKIFRKHIDIVMGLMKRRAIRTGFPNLNLYITSLIDKTLKREDGAIDLLNEVLKSYNPFLKPIFASRS